jgi:hypothetical protein
MMGAPLMIRVLADLGPCGERVEIAAKQRAGAIELHEAI